MDNRVVFLTASKTSQGQAFTKPRVVSLMENDFDRIIPGTVNKLSAVKLMKSGTGEPGETHIVYEAPTEIEAARNPASTDIYLKAKIKVGLTAVGTVQGGLQLTTGYINELTTVTTGSAEAVTLPAATVGKVVVIINNGAGIAQPFPTTGEFIDSGLVNAVGGAIPSGTRRHFVCPTTAGKWVTADDYTQV